MGNKEKERKRKLRAKQRTQRDVQAFLGESSQDSADDLVSSIERAKRSIYSITRIRREGSLTYYATLGTGFLVAPGYLLSCAHVFSNPENENSIGSHQDGDTYYLLQKDENGGTHEAVVSAELNSSLFLYPEQDCAILKLPTSFYRGSDNQPAKDKNEFLAMEAKALPITSDVVVLGYPIEQEGVKIMDDGSINHLMIQPRGDKGSVNTRYHDGSRGWFCYEFTMAFNPGNSGGPIIDAKSGNVVAIVHGYKSFPIKEIVEEFETLNPDGSTEKIRQLARIRATYSIGIAVESFTTIASDHSITIL